MPALRCLGYSQLAGQCLDPDRAWAPAARAWSPWSIHRAPGVRVAAMAPLYGCEWTDSGASASRFVRAELRSAHADIGG